MRDILRRVFLILCLCLPGAAPAAEETLDASAVALIGRLFPRHEIRWTSSGALSAPGSVDAAVVLWRGGERPVHVIALLARQADGAYRLSRRSRDLDAPPGAYEVIAEIRKGSLRLRLSNPGAAVSDILEYQFKPRDGRLRLIGVRRQAFSHADDDFEYEYDVSANLLTGEKVDRIRDRVDGRLKRLERRSRVPARAPIDFEDFHFGLDLERETHKAIGRDFRPRRAPGSP